MCVCVCVCVYTDKIIRMIYIYHSSDNKTKCSKFTVKTTTVYKH